MVTIPFYTAVLVYRFYNERAFTSTVAGLPITLLVKFVDKR